MKTGLNSIIDFIGSLTGRSRQERQMIHALKSTLKQNSHLKKSLHMMSINVAQLKQRLEATERELQRSRSQLANVQLQVANLVQPPPVKVEEKRKPVGTVIEPKSNFSNSIIDQTQAADRAGTKNTTIHEERTIVSGA